MADSAQITAAAYDPNDGLRDLLSEVLRAATVSYVNDQVRITPPDE